MDIREYTHALIGCGRIAPVHKDALESLGVQNIIYCDLQEARARDLSQGGGPVFSDYRSIPCENLHGVSICTDHASHLPLADYFLKRGVSVIVEKPCCLPGESIQDLFRKYPDPFPVFSQVAQHRYDSIVLFVRELIRKGKMGRLVMGDFTLYCRRMEDYFMKSPWKGKFATEGGSAMINQAFHLVDLVSFLFGRPRKVESILGNHYLKDVIETDETGFVLFHYNDFSVSLKATICSSETWMTRLDVIGDAGMVSFSIDEPFEFYHYSDSLRNDVERFLAENAEDCISVSPNGYFGNSHKKQIRSFVESVLAGRSIGLPGRDAIIDTQKLINSIYL